MKLSFGLIVTVNVIYYKYSDRSSYKYLFLLTSFYVIFCLVTGTLILNSIMTQFWIKVKLYIVKDRNVEKHAIQNPEGDLRIRHQKWQSPSDLW